MKKSFISLLFFLSFLLLSIVNCNKNVAKPEDEWKLSPDNKFEKPLSSINSAIATTSSDSSSNLRMSATADYSCGAYLTSNYYGVGYYTYPNYALNLSSTPQGSTINVLVHSYDIPNRFTIKDAIGNIYASTSWMGHVTYSGPWGPSLNTPETQNLTFALGTTTSLILKVETSTTTYSDNWDATVGCTPPITTTYGGVSITFEPLNNILRFNTLTDLDTVVTQLQTAYDTYNDNYDAQYPNYTADQLDSMDQINNFDEFRPFKDFENLFSGYSSIRKQIENTEITWLNNNMTGTDPDDIDFTFDDAVNTIFNANYSVKVGTDIYQMRSDGIYKNGGLVSGRLSATRSTCITIVKNKQKFSYGSNRYFKLKVAVLHFVFRTQAKAKVVSFKGTKRSRSTMAVGFNGLIYITADE